MELFNEIKTFLNHIKQEIVLFNFLALYDESKDNTECLKLFLNLRFKLARNVKQYELKNDETLYNIIDNDFITLKDLYEEYKEHIYALFPFKALALVKKLNEYDLALLSKYYVSLGSTNNQVDSIIKQILHLLNMINDQEYKNQVINYLDHNLSDERIEQIILSLKKYKDSVDIWGIKDEYVKLIFIYFNYLLKEE